LARAFGAEWSVWQIKDLSLKKTAFLPLPFGHGSFPIPGGFAAFTVYCLLMESPRGE